MKVYFAIPSYGGIKCVPFIDSLKATLDLAMERGHEPYVDIHSGCCYVQLARNELVKRFLDSGFDALFFLDDDLEWNPRDALRLIEMPEEMVAGVYPRKSEIDDYPVVVKVDDEGRPIVRADGCLDAPFVPTGFLRIRRSVFEKLEAANPQQKYAKQGCETEEYFDLFPQGVYGGRWWGEDFAFCRMWQNIGGQSWVVPNITLKHHSASKVYTGNYHEYLLRCPGGSEEQAESTVDGRRSAVQTL